MYGQIWGDRTKATAGRLPLRDSDASTVCYRAQPRNRAVPRPDSSTQTKCHFYLSA